MGLDADVFKTDFVPDQPVGFKYRNFKESFKYWRNHIALNRWFGLLFQKKGGGHARDFNCQSIQLTTEDLNELESDLKNDFMPYTGNPEDDLSEEQVADYLSFIEEAKEYISQGYTVIYYSDY